MDKQNIVLLGRADIARVMTFADYIAAVEHAFRSMQSGEVRVPEPVHLPGVGGSFHVKSAAGLGRPPRIVVKINGNFPSNPARSGLPTIQGVVVLCDGNDGSPLAVMDSAELTAMRTAAATAVAARYLAPPGATTATVIGCGLQGPLQLLALLEVLPIKTVFLYDADASRCAVAAERLGTHGGVRVEVAADLARATRASQVIVTATSSRKAFLRRGHLSPGTFIAAVGADSPDKQELAPEVLAGAEVVVDSLDQCAKIGELHHAIEAGVMDRTKVVTELGAIIQRGLPVKFAPEAIVVYDSTGTANQDLAAADMIYEKALQHGLGMSMQLA